MNGRFMYSRTGTPTGTGAGCPQLVIGTRMDANEAHPECASSLVPERANCTQDHSKVFGWGVSAMDLFEWSSPRTGCFPSRESVLALPGGSTCSSSGKRPIVQLRDSENLGSERRQPIDFTEWRAEKIQFIRGWGRIVVKERTHRKIVWDTPACIRIIFHTLIQPVIKLWRLLSWSLNAGGKLFEGSIITGVVHVFVVSTSHVLRAVDVRKVGD